MEKSKTCWLSDDKLEPGAGGGRIFIIGRSAVVNSEENKIVVEVMNTKEVVGPGQDLVTVRWGRGVEFSGRLCLCVCGKYICLCMCVSVSFIPDVHYKCIVKSFPFLDPISSLKSTNLLPSLNLLFPLTKPPGQTSVVFVMSFFCFLSEMKHYLSKLGFENRINEKANLKVIVSSPFSILTKDRKCGMF